MPVDAARVRPGRDGLPVVPSYLDFSGDKLRLLAGGVAVSMEGLTVVSSPGNRRAYPKPLGRLVHVDTLGQTTEALRRPITAEFPQDRGLGAGLTLAEMLRARALAGTGSSNKSAVATITLIVTRGPLAGQHYAFDKPTTCVVGRARDCTISLPPEAEHLDVSRHHCLLDISPPAVRVRDLGSANGTFVNGRKIGQRDSRAAPGSAGQAGWQTVELSAGDEIQLGDHTAFRVSVSPPPDPGIWTGGTDVFEEVRSHE
jgi:hypothetical protein